MKIPIAGRYLAKDKSHLNLRFAMSEGLRTISSIKLRPPCPDPKRSMIMQNTNVAAMSKRKPISPVLSKGGCGCFERFWLTIGLSNLLFSSSRSLAFLILLSRSSRASMRALTIFCRSGVGSFLTALRSR